MHTDLAFTTLRQVHQALERRDSALGSGGTIVIPEPIWSEGTDEERTAFTDLAASRGFDHRIERRWQARPPHGHGITRISVER